MKTNSVRLGVDIGGTFTDVVLEGERRILLDQGFDHLYRPRKRHHRRYAAGLCQGRGRAVEIEPDHPRHHACDQRADRTARGQDGAYHHQGFRDVIEMRTESRFEQYDLNLTLPEPLLPATALYRVGAVDAQRQRPDPA